MKKSGLVLSLVFCLLLTLSVTALADTGFQVGLGYEDLNNELTLTMPYGELEVNSPCPMFFVEAGYNFGNSFAIDAKYGRCVGDQSVVGLDSSLIAAELATDDDTDYSSIEGSYQKQIGSFKLVGILGYSDSNYNRTVRIGENSGTLNIDQNVSGAYLGGEVSYAPNDQFQAGVTYRWMIDPDVELQVANLSVDASDPESSQLEVFAQTALTEKLKLKASYSVAWVEYDISVLNIENKTDGLSLKLQYQF